MKRYSSQLDQLEQSASQQQIITNKAINWIHFLLARAVPKLYNLVSSTKAHASSLSRSTVASATIQHLKSPPHFSDSCSTPAWNAVLLASDNDEHRKLAVRVQPYRLLKI